MQTIKKEAKKVEDKVYVYKTKDHFELRMLGPNRKPEFRGFKINKSKDGNVNNGELYDHVIGEIMQKFFKLTNKTLTPVLGKVIIGDIQIEARKSTKTVVYTFNDDVMFKMRLARTDLENEKGENYKKYVFTEKAVDKTFEEIWKYLKAKMTTTKEDFIICKDLISAIDEYLIK